MPKSKEYVSTSDSGSESDEPKPKKKKEEKKKEKSKAGSSGATKNADGEVMFQLARMRFATVTEFRGRKMVNIREYYEKDGEMRPGKKGIALNEEQWKKLKDNIDDIDKALEDL